MRPFSEVVRVIRKASNREDKPLLWEEVFLIHTYIYPLMGTVDRYRDLGINEYQGGKHRGSLQEKGFVTLEAVPTETGRIKLIVPTRKGFAWLKERGFSTHSDKEGSIEHQYWKRRMRDHLKSMGYDAKLEVDLGSNMAVDIVASDENRRVCIEIETGKNTTEQICRNIRKGLSYAAGVICFLLTPQRAQAIREQVPEDRTFIVTSAAACMAAAKDVLAGDTD